MKEIKTLTSIILLVIFLLIFWPLAAIWSLNTLFGLTIPFTFWNWLAVTVLTATVNSSGVGKSK
jgi:hypothetical protein